MRRRRRKEIDGMEGTRKEGRGEIKEERKIKERGRKTVEGNKERILERDNVRGRRRQKKVSRGREEIGGKMKGK